jgi:hypothetical protein
LAGRTRCETWRGSSSPKSINNPYQAAQTNVECRGVDLIANEARPCVMTIDLSCTCRGRCREDADLGDVLGATVRHADRQVRYSMDAELREAGRLTLPYSHDSPYRARALPCLASGNSPSCRDDVLHTAEARSPSVGRWAVALLQGEIRAIRVRLQLLAERRSRTIRAWYRQQAARLRWAEGSRRLPRRPRRQLTRRSSCGAFWLRGPTRGQS